MRIISPLLLTLLLAVIAADDASAQMPQGPAKELASFERLLGDFEGSGEVVSAPGAPPGRWTAKTSCKKALGGHFLREDTCIDLGADVPTPLLFTAFYGYDRERQRHMSYGMNNMGEVTATEIHCAGDTLIWTASTAFQGQPKIERWQIEFTDTGYDMLGEEAVGSADFHTHVRGTFKRVKGSKPEIADAAFALSNDVGKMADFAKMAGEYRLEGKMVPMVGAPEMAIAGDMEMQPVFGGTVLWMSVIGDPIPGMGKYEGVGAIGYDAHGKCYDSFWIDNFGDAHFGQCRWSGRDLITTGERIVQGQPVLQRTILTCDESGVPVAEKSHQLNGTHDPAVNFEAKYTRR